MKLLLSFFLCCFTLALHAQSLQSNGNTLLLNVDNNTTTISENAIAEGAFIYKSKVYFMDKDKRKITAYDIQTQQAKDIIAVGMKTDNGYEIRTNIVKMMPLTSAGKLYFSTYYIHGKLPVYTTWQFDIDADNYYIFRDGIVDQTQDDGTIELVSYGTDPNGEYSERFYYYHGNGKLIKSDERAYK